MKRKKIVLLGLFILLIGVLVLAGCSPRQNQAPAPEEVTVSSEPETEPEPMLAPEPEPMSEAELQIAFSGTVVGGVREVNVVASRFDFESEVITVRQGEEVRLLLTTNDVAHGIGLREFGINARIAAGETTVVTFVADTSGEFTFFCSVPCGAGHGSMKGQLLVI